MSQALHLADEPLYGFLAPHLQARAPATERAGNGQAYILLLTRHFSTLPGRLAVLVGLCASAVAMPPSHAQQATGADSDVLQEINITAERRSEKLQSVPIAVTALQGSDLEDKAVTTISDLQYASPSLSIGNSGLTSGSPAVANGVATYYDGLFQPPIVSTNQFYDIADIEVLRGPQGTLVGSNSTGGAIFINTQNPKLGQSDGS